MLDWRRNSMSKILWLARAVINMIVAYHSACARPNPSVPDLELYLHGKIPSHLPSRLFWLLFGLGLGSVQIVEGIRHGLLGPVISGLGLALLGVTGFIQPLLQGSPAGSVLGTLNNSIVDSKPLRTILGFSSFACLFVGLILKYLVEV